LLFEPGETRRDDALVSPEAVRKPKVGSGIEGAPIVDSVEYREVAGDVVLILNYPSNLL
jgi:hypothetical protein